MLSHYFKRWNQTEQWRRSIKGNRDVPKTTLMRLSDAKYGTPEEAPNTKTDIPTVLRNNLEDQLVHYRLAMEPSFYGLTRNDLRRMAVQLAERNNAKYSFKDEIAVKSDFCQYERYWLIRTHFSNLPAKQYEQTLEKR
ncbi:hypothetical protein FQA39_LY05295 [Lamprigera yunnana]|nr:hypothetical protein FQA39_LY05295 [Lamprigera yunnana]